MCCDAIVAENVSQRVYGCCVVSTASCFLHAVRVLWCLRHARALAWHRGAVCACMRVCLCWCRRIFTCIHTHILCVCVCHFFFLHTMRVVPVIRVFFSATLLPVVTT